MVRLFFNIWPFGTRNLARWCHKFAKVCSAYCQIRNKPSKICQSGEISSNMVTLLTMEQPSIGQEVGQRFYINLLCCKIFKRGWADTRLSSALTTLQLCLGETLLVIGPLKTFSITTTSGKLRILWCRKQPSLMLHIWQAIDSSLSSELHGFTILSTSPTRRTASIAQQPSLIFQSSSRSSSSLYANQKVLTHLHSKRLSLLVLLLIW